MPWLPFTAVDIKSRLAVRELETYEETATAENDNYPGTDERIPAILSQTLGLFRGKIRSNPQVTQLGPEGTLPDFCIFPACVIARVALVGMNPVPEGMTDPRRDEYRDAMKILEGLSSLNSQAFDLADPPMSPIDGRAYPSFGGKCLLDF